MARSLRHEFRIRFPQYEHGRDTIEDILRDIRNGRTVDVHITSGGRMFPFRISSVYNPGYGYRIESLNHREGRDVIGIACRAWDAIAMAIMRAAYWAMVDGAEGLNDPAAAAAEE